MSNNKTQDVEDGSDGLFLLIDTTLTYDSDTNNYINVTKITQNT